MTEYCRKKQFNWNFKETLKLTELGEYFMYWLMKLFKAIVLEWLLKEIYHVSHIVIVQTLHIIIWVCLTSIKGFHQFNGFFNTSLQYLSSFIFIDDYLFTSDKHKMAAKCLSPLGFTYRLGDNCILFKLGLL